MLDNPSECWTVRWREGSENGGKKIQVDHFFAWLFGVLSLYSSSAVQQLTMQRMPMISIEKNRGIQLIRMQERNR